MRGHRRAPPSWPPIYGPTCEWPRRMFTHRRPRGERPPFAAPSAMTDRRAVLAARVSAPGCHVCLAEPEGSAARAVRLRREPGDRVEPSLHPAGERIISRIAFGSMHMKPDKARPANSTGRTCGSRSACSRLSAPTRTISAVPVMPPHILPLTRKDRPPTSFFSTTSHRPDSNCRTRSAAAGS
jgi:hypothetical protein